MSQSHKHLLVIVAVLAILCLVPDIAHATDAQTGLEWEGPFKRFVASITGPIAFGISFVSLCGCGFALVWGGEINEFLRRGIMLVLVISFIVFAGSIMRNLFAGGAATFDSAPAAVVATEVPRHE